LVATWQPAAPARYYRDQTSYYSGGVEPRGRWFAPAGDFGLRDGAEVDETEFERLYAGVGPDGRSLATTKGGRADRVPAYDYTFSFQKSVSIVWAFSPAEETAATEAAAERAVRDALTFLESEASFARRGKGGERHEQVPLSAAVFRHGESRPAKHSDGKTFGDVNLHYHAVILAIATRADGSIGARASIPLRDVKKLAGAVMFASCAYELGALGFAIDRIGPNGEFEIAGIPDALIQYSSARRTGIETELAKSETTSAAAPALAAAIAKATRGAKNETASANREAIWVEAVKAQGFDVGALLAGARREVARDPIEGERLFAERLAALPATLTEGRSVFDRIELLRSVAVALVGTGLTVSRIEPAVAELLKAEQIVEIGEDRYGRPKYSTPEMIALEREVADCARRLAEADAHRLDPVEIARLCANAGLSAEQTAAAVGACGPEALALTVGPPGSGKTELLKPIAKAHRAAGRRVIGAAVAWRVANALNRDLAIPSRAIASWVEITRRQGDFLRKGDLLIVDEAGLISSRDMHVLLTEVERAGAKALLVGDPRQLESIGPPGLPLVTRALDALRVERIVRQRDEWARAAIHDFGAGRAKEALRAFDDRGKLVVAEGGAAALDAVVEAWQAGRAAGAAPLLLARTNRQVGAISDCVRTILRAEGRLTGEDATITTATPSGQSTRIAMAKGDAIRFLVRNDALGVINGTEATVVSVRRKAAVDAADDNTARIVVDIGDRRIEFQTTDLADAKGRAKLGYAYAATVFQSQGMTVDRAVVLLDDGYDRRQAYVAASRSRLDTVLVVDGAAIDKRLASDLPIDRQSEDRRFSAAERRGWLAARLSRASAKETTLDVVRSAENEPELSERERERSAARTTERGRNRSRELSRD
jgi:conjugative relaxase-like TrwC/TraI family protein